jgi:hypothetical protein
MERLLVMECTPKTRAARSYTRRIMITMAFYMVACILAVAARNNLHTDRFLVIILAIATAIPLVAVIAIVGLYLKEETDEFQRELLVQQLLWATGLTLTSTSTWGMLEMFSGLPRLPAFYIFVIFWIFFGLASFPLRRRYRTVADE